MTAPTLSGLLAITFWSTLALLTTTTGALPPFQILAITFAVSALLGLVLLLRPGGPGLLALRQPPRAAALSTLALFGYHALYFVALKRAPAVEANLLNYLWPLLIVLFAAFLPGARIRAPQIVGALLGLLAAVLLLGRGRVPHLDPAYLPGYAAALAAALTWSAYSVANRRFSHVSSAAIVGPCLAVSLLGAAAHVLVERTIAPTPSQWIVLAAMGLGPVGAAFWLWDTGTKRGDIGLLGTLSYAAPVLSTGLLLAFGRAEPHWTQAAALALLLLGATLSVRASTARGGLGERGDRGAGGTHARS
ncbi:aromatic amino acid exporter YddG [Chondromyces apiculatus]|uniref:Permease of the drug/metabolite transporter (DMT) superfamily n=1 Tax=Chondromyces apiculatus DSM 436 TaxID=1192034 RepID=A0A017T2R2_9BACT|nr:Permease of the drug/metabolite transporter (DMT) superfamily [Chondromyces apiculatus DSM 436]